MIRVTLRNTICALAAGTAAAFAASPQTPGSVPISALRACAAIDATGSRLDCYDRLAGRSPTPTPTPTPPPRTPARLAPRPAVAPTGAAASVVAPTPASAPNASFGLYALEHPAPPKAAALVGIKVVAVADHDDGSQTVTLAGGQLWKLDSADPLLAAGDAVTIRRAALGSFLMSTPTGRTHRVRRLR